MLVQFYEQKKFGPVVRFDKTTQTCLWTEDRKATRKGRSNNGILCCIIPYLLVCGIILSDALVEGV